MNVAQKARKNYEDSFKFKIESYFYDFKIESFFPNGDGTTFNHPNKLKGYGKILYGIATAPVEHLISKKKLNAWLHNPNKKSWGSASFERLRRAKLIIRRKVGWKLTALGKKYVKEMHIVD